MLRMASSTLFVGVCSLAGVRRRRSPALMHERRVIQRATGSLELGARLPADGQSPGTPLTTPLPDPAAHAACCSVLAIATALAQEVATFAAFPVLEPDHLLRAETHTPRTVEDDEFCPTWDTSAGVAIEANDGPSRTFLVQCDPIVDGIFFLAVADRAHNSAASASLVTCARPPVSTSPIREYALPSDDFASNESDPRTGDRTAPEDGDPTHLVALGPDDQLPLDFGDVVINSMRED